MPLASTLAVAVVGVTADRPIQLFLLSVRFLKTPARGVWFPIPPKLGVSSGVQTRVNVDGVLAPLARGDGGKTNNVCVADGVGNTMAGAAGCDGSAVELPERAFLMGKGTNEESLDERRRDLEGVDEAALDDVDEMDAR